MKKNKGAFYEAHEKLAQEWVDEFTKDFMKKLKKQLVTEQFNDWLYNDKNNKKRKKK